jgi:hypothetical protein
VSTARDELVEKLAGLEDLPENVRVVPYARSMTIAGPTLMVRVDTVGPADAGHRFYGWSLIVAVPYTDPTGPADDALDASLEDVLYALEDVDFLRFNTAERATLEDQSYPCYRIDVTTKAKKEVPAP